MSSPRGDDRKIECVLNAGPPGCFCKSAEYKNWLLKAFAFIMSF